MDSMEIWIESSVKWHLDICRMLSGKKEVLITDICVILYKFIDLILI